jgi:hypothetical protein
MPRRSATATLLVLTVLVASAAARAQSAPPSEGLGKPCQQDVARLCPGVKPGGGRIAACLQGKADEISEACKARIEQAKEVNQACHADAEKFCNDVPPGHGRVAVCIQDHEAELSQACRTHLQQVRARIKEVKAACQDDARKFCTNVPPGRGRVAVCLHEHAPDLCGACRQQLGAM